METWKIIIFIVVFILCALGLWYAVKLRVNEIKDKLYVYPKNDHYYEPLFRCRMKNPTSGEWLDAIIYQDYDTKHLYVRDRKDFFDKFVKLLDWENEKVSANRESEKS